jgi:integrase
MRSGARYINEIRELVETSGHRAGRRKVGSGVLSLRTQEAREEELIISFRQINNLGFKLESVYGLREKHVSALVKALEHGKYSASTIQNRLSHLRWLCTQIGKAGMIKPAHVYAESPLSVKLVTNAEKDHSWRAAGLIPERMILLIESEDRYVAMQLRLCMVFMLRRRESIMFRPHIADRGDHIIVEEGTKGGRVRAVPVTTSKQRQVLDQAKQFVGNAKLAHMGDPNKTLKQNIARFAYVLRKFGLSRDQLGVTAHGLRHEGLGDMFEELAGVPAPVRVNDPAAVLAGADKNRVEFAQKMVAEAAGHSRLAISGAYIGSLTGRNLKKILERKQENKKRDVEKLDLLLGKDELSEDERAETKLLLKRVRAWLSPSRS